MSSIIRRGLTGALVALTLTGAVATASPQGDADAGAPVCRDSNGPVREGGSVYVAFGRPTGCDVVAPQRLHVTRVPSRAACDDMGGHGWQPRARVCWDIDY